MMRLPLFFRKKDKKETLRSIDEILVRADKNRKLLTGRPLVKWVVASSVVISGVVLFSGMVVFGKQSASSYAEAKREASRQVREVKEFDRYKKVIDVLKQKKSSGVQREDSEYEGSNKFSYTALLEAKRRYAVASMVLSEKLKLAQLLAKLRKTEINLGRPVDAYVAQMSMEWERGPEKKYYLSIYDAKKYLVQELQKEINGIREDLSQQQQSTIMLLERKLLSLERKLEALRSETKRIKVKTEHLNRLPSMMEEGYSYSPKDYERVAKCKCNVEALLATGDSYRVKIGDEWLDDGNPVTSDGCCLLKGVDVTGNTVKVKVLKLASPGGKRVEVVQSVRL